MPTYTATEPARHDEQCIVGDTWRLDLTLEDTDGTPFDLTGVTGTSKVRVEPAGTVVATPTVALVSATDGQFSVTLAAATTTLLQAGEYHYAVRLTWGDGSVHTVVEGRLVVRRSLV